MSPPLVIWEIFVGTFRSVSWGLKCLFSFVGIRSFDWGLKCLPLFVGIRLFDWGLKCLFLFVGAW